MVFEIEMDDYFEAQTVDTYLSIIGAYRSGEKDIRFKLPYDSRDSVEEKEAIESLRNSYTEDFDSMEEFLAEESFNDQAARYLTKDMWKPGAQDGYHDQVGFGLFGVCTIGTALIGLWPAAAVGAAGMAIKTYQMVKAANERDKADLQMYKELSELDIEFVYG